MSPNPKRTLPSLSLPAGGPAEYAEPEAPVREAGSEPEPPIARPVPRVHTVHGESRIDEYHWLRNRDDPEVLAHLEAENRYTDSVMRHTEGLQERLYQELRGRIKEADLSVPDPRWTAGSTTRGPRPERSIRSSVAGATRRTRRKRCCWTSTSSPPGTPTSGWARSRSARTTGCSPIRWTPAGPSRSPSS